MGGAIKALFLAPVPQNSLTTTATRNGNETLEEKVRSMAPRPSLPTYLHPNSNNKRLRHGQPHHERPKQSDSPQNEATLGTWTSKPDVLHPNEDNGSESGDVNHQTINNEASQQIQRDGQCTCQPENGLSRQWMEVSNTEAATTEIVTKVLEEKGDAIGLSAPLTFTTFPPAEIPRDAGIREAILPIDKDWVMVDDAVSLVSQLALSNCQHKLREEQQGAPLLGPTSCGAGAGEPQSRFSLLHIMECALAGSPTRCPDPIAQAHRAQHPSLSKHVGSGGTHPGGTDQREVGELFTFATSQQIS